MASLSDLIEQFIKEILEEADGVAEIQRNELASQFNCVPSQINYVLATRFTNENGYYVESRRGGGGKIIIKRINYDRPQNCYLHFLSCLGDSISQKSADILINNMMDYDLITYREYVLLRGAVSNRSLALVSPEDRDKVRASMLKNIILSMMV